MRRSGFWALAAGAILSAVGARPADFDRATIADREVDRLLTVTLVAPEALDPVALSNFYRQRLDKARVKPRVFVLLAFPGTYEAGLISAGKGPEATFEQIEARYREARGRWPVRAARILAIGSNALLQQTDGKNVSRRILSGSDPTIFRAGSHAYELLELHVAVLPRPLRPRVPNRVRVDCYVKTAVLPTPLDARLVARALQAALGERHVTVTIRTDSWFVEDLSFPLWYPFEPAGRFPSRAEYVARGEIYCDGDAADIRCVPTRFPGL